MAGISLQVKADKKAFEAELAAMGRRVESPAPRLMKNFGEHMLRSVDKNFSGEGRPVKWKPLTRAYAKRKTRGGKILTASARLRRSITYVVRGWNLVVGTNVKYARIHQLGGEISHPGGHRVLAIGAGNKFISRKQAGSRKRGATSVRFAKIGAYTITMPPRPFLVIQEEDRKVLAEESARFIAKGTAR